MRKKNFTMGKGFYYFNVKSGQQMITIFRKTKAAATLAFHNYQKVGKTCEWLGCWDGKKFSETTPPAMAKV